MNRFLMFLLSIIMIFLGFSFNASAGGYCMYTNFNTRDSNFLGSKHLNGLAMSVLELTHEDIDKAVEYIFAADYSLNSSFEKVYFHNNDQRISLKCMDFGAKNHFWATGSDSLYEIDDGALEYIDHDDNNDVNPVPESATILLLGIGLTGFAISRRKKII